MRVEVVNLHYHDDDGDVDDDDDEEEEGNDDDDDTDDGDDVNQHASALVGELGPLYCPQTPLVLRFQNQNKSK